MNRRELLKSAAFSSAVVASGRILSIAESAEGLPVTTRSSNPAQLPRRDYGKTGIKLSVIGLGGIVVKDVEQNVANRVVAEAVERGVNYFDVAPTYGNAETRLGPALQPYRKDVFLACKTVQRQRAGVETELKRSLERLKTDHLDLYQLHALTDVQKDVDTVFARGGAMEVLIAAKRTGQVRFLGFSAHSVEAARLALERYPFDSVLFPVNFASFAVGNFGPQIVELAESKGFALLALKAMARQKWAKDDPNRRRYPKCWYEPLTDENEAGLGLRFTLSQPVTAAIPPGDESLFRLALDIAARFRPLTAAEEKEVRTLATKLDPVFSA